MKPFVVFNGVKFAASKALLTESLFDPSGTASGTFKVKRNGVLFSKPTGEPFAFLVANPGQSRFVVSCCRQDDGRIRYMLGGLCDADARLLGVDKLGYMAKMDACERLWNEVTEQLQPV